MLFSLDNAFGYQIAATDGDVGTVADIYIDDGAWTIRYLVVDTGWLFGRRVLIAPEAVTGIDADKLEVAVTLSRAQIEEGPGIRTDLPVSRQEEMALRSHYGWSRYWELYPSWLSYAPVIPPLLPLKSDEPQGGSVLEAQIRARSDPHLRSAREVMGYHIDAMDGEVGHVCDFIAEYPTWIVRYLVVDTRNWLPGRKVLLAPSWASGISWSDRLVKVKLGRETIRQSPNFEALSNLDRDFESNLHDHYARPYYWE